MKAEIKYEASPVIRRLAGAASRFGKLRPVLQAFGRHMVEMTRLRFTEGRDSLPGEPPTKRSTQLSQSIGFRILAGDDGIAVGSNMPYAGIQQTGGIIVPRLAGALTIPISDFAREKFRKGWRARDFQNTFLVKKGDGSGDTIGTVMQRYGAQGKQVRALFILRRKVVLPARPWLVVRDEDWEWLRLKLRDYVFELDTVQ